jgi:glycerol-3-phosphate dehydrogenase
VWGQVYDLAVIGGGIIGCAVARDAAGRGLSVYLCEQGDLGSGSSSASTGLIGVRAAAFPPVSLRALRETMRERDLLRAAAPHIVRPLRFVEPVAGSSIALLSGRAELAVADRLGAGRGLARPRTVELVDDPLAAVLRPEYRRGLEYHGCLADAARLVILLAVDARMRGAEIRPRTRAVLAEREGGCWRLAVEEAGTGERYAVEARALVNAAGPWGGHVLNHVVDARSRPDLRFAKGSHVVVRRILPRGVACAFRNTDGRTIFALPYARDFTLIGASEDDWHDDPEEAAADSAELAYLAAAVAEYLRRPVHEAEIVWAFSGIYASRAAERSRTVRATHDGVVEIDSAAGQPPLVSIHGGSLVTHRLLAEAALARLAPFIDTGRPWTRGAYLPGGHLPTGGLGDLYKALLAGYPFLSPRHAERLVLAYGTRAQAIVSGARSLEDLGRVFGADLTEAELRYLVAEEFAMSAEDVLFRRTKLGLSLAPEEVAGVEDWFRASRAAAAGPRSAQPALAGAG